MARNFSDRKLYTRSVRPRFKGSEGLSIGSISWLPGLGGLEFYIHSIDKPSIEVLRDLVTPKNQRLGPGFNCDWANHREGEYVRENPIANPRTNLNPPKAGQPFSGNSRVTVIMLKPQIGELRSPSGGIRNHYR